jgi:N-acetylglucosamine-6-phosphate deacetylase
MAKYDKIIMGAKIALPPKDNLGVWENPQENHIIGIKDNIITLIDDAKNINAFDTAQIIKLDGGIVTAGFIDTQVNGGGGVLFNDNPNLQTILKILEGHKKSGTTQILPTLISDDIEKVELAIEAVKTLVESKTNGILGLHLEGPLISPAKKGIHDESKFLTLDNDLVELFGSLQIAPTLITLAPEMHNRDFVRALDNMPNVIIAIGHSNASAVQTMQAVEDGARGLTHLFNAMSGLSARNPGIIGFALQNGGLYCGIIVDLVHVDAQNVKLAYQCLGATRLMLVSDAMNTIGTNDTSFVLYGKEIMVRDGSCFDENGTLAGSALNMLMAVQNAHFKVGIPLGACLQMASETPARFLHKFDEIGSIRIGNRADLIHLDDNLNFIGNL